MKNLVFLDTETTGNNLYVDRLFEVAYKFENKTYSEYFKPELPISVKSSSITHVTNEMMEDKPSFSSSQMKKDLVKIFETNILVAHSAEFDLEILAQEKVKVDKFICTLKISRYLDDESEIPEYGLQYLRYYHDLKVENTGSHDAKSDIKVLEALFEFLYKKMKRSGESDEKVIERMVKISKEPVLFKVFGFGKHKGKKLEEVVTYDRGYLEWMLRVKSEDNFVQEDWIFTLKHYLQIKD